jgi:hypothetical protein
MKSIDAKIRADILQAAKESLLRGRHQVVGLERFSDDAITPPVLATRYGKNSRAGEKTRRRLVFECAIEVRRPLPVPAIT